MSTSKILNEEYITFATSKLLKEKNINLDCNTIYTKDGIPTILKDEKEYYLRPIQSLLMRYIGEIHKLSIEIVFCYNDGFFISLKDMNSKECAMLCEHKDDSFSAFKTYEEALEYGLVKVIKAL